MADKYTIYKDGDKYKIVEVNNVWNVIKSGLTATEAIAKCAKLNGK